MKIIDRLKESMKREEQDEDTYMELDADKAPEHDEKLFVRPFIIDDFSDLKPILDSLREGNTIALINIRPLREKDLLELKRAVAKVKKTVEAINGDIRGFGEDHLIVVPSFIQIAKQQEKAEDVAVGPKPYYDEK